MFERHQGGERVILVHVNFVAVDQQEDFQEFQLLATSSGAKPVATVISSSQKPAPKYFVGSGKAAEIAQCVQENKADLVLFNHELSPAQERNCETLFKCRVLSRTGLILDIFAQRAHTFEGKLQVELAQLQHIATRLVRGWTHLERQKGGIGLRGPGETQLESDRRLIRGRIKTIQQRLVKVQAQRTQNRRARRKAAIPIVALAGYTNAGKSTLFNALTAANVYAADQLFATLDPTLRKVEVPGLGAVILVDTVGFISHLPHGLVNAFRATLEETREADLILHIIDAADVRRQENITQVETVLNEIGAATVPRLNIYNKIDLLEYSVPRLEQDAQNSIKSVYISASKEQGLDLVYQALSTHLQPENVCKTVLLAPEQSRLRAQLYAINAVQAEKIDEQGICHLNIQLPCADYQRLFHKS